MLPWTALLCVAMILKGISTLPTDASSTTSAGAFDKSNATLNSRDVPPEIFAFYFSCPNPKDLPNANGGAGAVREYTPETCQEVHQFGYAILVNWKVGGFDMLQTYSDTNCKIPIVPLHSRIDRKEFDSRVRVKSCFNLDRRGPKVASVQSTNQGGAKREIHPSAAALGSREITDADTTLSMRDTTYLPPGGMNAVGGINSAPEAVRFWDHCPYDSKGNDIDANPIGADVEGYIVGTCQEINPSGPTMSIHYKEGGFDRMIIYQDNKCTDRITAYDRGTTTWKDVSCVDLKTIPKALSFKGVKMNVPEQR